MDPIHQRATQNWRIVEAIANLLYGDGAPDTVPVAQRDAEEFLEEVQDLFDRIRPDMSPYAGGIGGPWGPPARTVPPACTGAR